MTTLTNGTKDKAPPPAPAGKDDAVPPKPPPASESSLPVDLAALPDDVLAALDAAVPKEIAARQAKREADLFTEFRERARALGVTPVRLAAALGLKLGTSATRRPSLLRPESAPEASEAGGGRADDGRSEVKPKYRNPDNPAQLWTGRGKPPPWITLGDECSPRGTRLPLAKFRIPDDADPTSGPHRA